MLPITPLQSISRSVPGGERRQEPLRTTVSCSGTPSPGWGTPPCSTATCSPISRWSRWRTSTTGAVWRGTPGWTASWTSWRRRRMWGSGWGTMRGSWRCSGPRTSLRTSCWPSLQVGPGLVLLWWNAFRNIWFGKEGNEVIHRQSSRGICSLQQGTNLWRQFGKTFVLNLAELWKKVQQYLSVKLITLSWSSKLEFYVKTWDKFGNKRSSVIKRIFQITIQQVPVSWGKW